MRGPASRVSAAIALLALVCAWPLSGCDGSDDSGSDQPKTTASGEIDASGGGEHAGTTQSSSGESSTSQGSGDKEIGSGPPSPDQPSSQAQRHPSKKPHKPPKSQSGGGPTAGLSPQEAATYEAARALCANPDALQYAPAEIRDDAEALAGFAQRYAPPGEEQIVHDGCLVGLKSIGID